MSQFLITFMAAISISAASIQCVQAENLIKNADIAYGEYLAGECVTCHRSGAVNDGIPNISGMDADAFVYILQSYRSKELENKVMQLVASRLDDEQIASLAVYFASLSSK